MEQECLGDGIYAEIDEENNLILSDIEDKIVLNLVVLSNLYGYLRRWNQEATYKEAMELYREKKDA